MAHSSRISTDFDQILEELHFNGFLEFNVFSAKSSIISKFSPNPKEFQWISRKILVDFIGFWHNPRGFQRIRPNPHGIPWISTQSSSISTDSAQSPRTAQSSSISLDFGSIDPRGHQLSSAKSSEIFNGYNLANDNGFPRTHNDFNGFRPNSYGLQLNPAAYVAFASRPASSGFRSHPPGF